MTAAASRLRGSRGRFLVEPPEQRFEQHVDRSAGPDACHPWTGGIARNGYGTFSPTQGVKIGAHRFAWEQQHGSIPPGAVIDHTCHNGTGCADGDSCPHRRCCNVAHLEPTTPGDNLDRSHLAQQHKTHCPQNHEYTPENTRWHRPKRPEHNPSRSCRECARTREQARSPRRRRTHV